MSAAPRGRPPLSAEERLSARVEVRVSAAERETLIAWAASLGVTLAEAVRSTSLRAARRAR